MSAPYLNTPQQATKKSSNSTWVVILIVMAVLLVITLCVIGILVALLLPAVSQARVAAQRAMASNQAKQISLALLNYEAEYRQLPPAQTLGPDGQPTMSWRVELLPYLDNDNIYTNLQRDKPWDDPSNQVMTSEIIPAFTSPRCPESQSSPVTAFVAVVGPDTMIRPGAPTKLWDVIDGLSNTAFLLELRQSDIGWAEPRDVSVDEAIKLIQSCPDQAGLTIAMGDGSVTQLSPSTPAETIVKLFNCSDGAGGW